MAKDPPDDDRNLPAPLTYGGKVIRDHGEMVSLTDMWEVQNRPTRSGPPIGSP